MSGLAERNAMEKEVILSEIQMLKDKAKTASELTFLKETEKDYWNKLLDSNIRAGTMACMWCMKAQVVKRTSVAFFRWKYGVARNANNTDNAGVNAQQNPYDRMPLNAPRSAPISAALAHAINVANHVKHTDVVSELNSPANSGVFMSPSASVQAANTAATNVLQLDWQTMPPVGTPFYSWQDRRRAGSGSAGSGGSGGGGVGGEMGTPSGEFKFQQEEGSLAENNKQRLALLLRSLQQQQQAGGSSGGVGQGRGATLGLDGQPRSSPPGGMLMDPNEVDTYLVKALQDPAVDANAKREILMALSQDLLGKGPGPLSLAAASEVPADSNVSARSNLSLLRGAGSNPAQGTPLSRGGGGGGGGSRNGARSLSPNARARGGFGGTSPRGFFREDTHGVDGDFAPLPAYHHQSTAHTPQYDQNGHFLGRTPQTAGGFSVEFARHASTAAEEAHFAAHNRTYPPVSSSSNGEVSLRGTTSSQQSRGRTPLPRYLMPTNSYQKKVSIAGASPTRRDSVAGGKAGRSRSPSMITNSNSKHANNMFAGTSGQGGSPKAAYTIKEALVKQGQGRRSSIPEDRMQALMALQAPPKPGASPPPVQRHHSHVEKSPDQVPYGQLSFVDYQQRRHSGSKHNTNSSGGPNASFEDPRRSLSLPPPPPPASAPAAAGMSLPLPAAAMAAIAEVDRMVFNRSGGGSGGSGGVVVPHRADSFALPSQDATKDPYGSYDAYHRSSLHATSLDAAAGDGNVRPAATGVGGVSGGAGQTYMAAYYATDEEVPSSDDPHSPVYYASQQYTPAANGASAVHSLSGRADYSQFYASADRSNGGNGGGNAPGSEGPRRPQRRHTESSAKGRPMDKAQLALFMHGDVAGKPVNWHSTLRR